MYIIIMTTQEQEEMSRLSLQTGIPLRECVTRRLVPQQRQPGQVSYAVTDAAIEFGVEGSEFQPHPLLLPTKRDDVVANNNLLERVLWVADTLRLGHGSKEAIRKALNQQGFCFR